MAIPDYQSFMLPFLELLEDGQPKKRKQIYELLAKRFDLSESEKDELLPSGTHKIYKNRIGWAGTYLKKARLIESPTKGVYLINDRGANTLKEKPSHIDIKYLSRFPEFLEFRDKKTEAQSHMVDTDDNGEPNSTSITPSEALENAYQIIQNELAQEVLERILNNTPEFFENLVIDLLLAMGYGGSFPDAGNAIGKTGDEGIDGVIKEDKLGLDTIYIQAKRWQPGNVVGRPEIQKFVGALAGQRAKKGIFITTSSFTKDAIDYHNKTELKLALIDGNMLARMIIEYNIGVTTIAEYKLKRVDSDYFED